MKEICLTIRGCPARVHKALRDNAKRHNRSINAETIEVLKLGTAPQNRLSESELRRRIAELPFKAGLDENETRAAIREGRK